MRYAAMPEPTEKPLSSGSKFGLLLVVLIAILVAAVAYWAWSSNPPDVSTPEGSAAATPVKPAG